MDLQAAVNAEVIPWLHSDSAANLVWWTEAELYQWLDHMARVLSRDALLFVEADTSVTVSPGTAAYAVPSRHVATFYVSAGASSSSRGWGFRRQRVSRTPAATRTAPTRRTPTSRSPNQAMATSRAATGTTFE